MLGATDVIVVGGGVAGGTAALAAARKGARVTLLTAVPDPEETNTRYAQGGIIHTGPDDSPELLTRDIFAAGGGDPAAAGVLADEGPALVRRVLIEDLEVPFDREAGGFEGLHLTREGAHSVSRIIHHRDSTGREVQRAVTRALRAEERVTILPATTALELVVSRGRCVGVYAARDGEVVALLARGVVLATGGLGALYEHTTNPSHATGSGYDLALRAGAALRDLHYVQFHPTALYAPGTRGDRFLVSEAVRGEGGMLQGPDGEEVVDHPLGSLAPRDVVARAIRATMDRTGSPCAYLDVPHRPEAWLRQRFPAIYERCRESGIDMTREPIPVVPAAHYSCGGVTTDLRGRTSLRGLWAAGEVASTGLHGSNRLASTSLLEGLVFGWRAGEDAARPSPVPDAGTVEPPRIPPDPPVEAWSRLRRVMWEHAGLVRDAGGLRAGLDEVRTLEKKHGGSSLAGPLTIARTVLEGALDERQSRGCHYRSDARAGDLTLRKPVCRGLEVEGMETGANETLDLGDLEPEEMPGISLRALAAGYDGPALQALARMSRPTDDAGDLFERAGEKGRPSLPRGEAGLRVARTIARKIVSGEMDPHEGAHLIWVNVWDRCGRPDELTPFVGLASLYEADPERRPFHSREIVARAENLADEQEDS